MKKLLSLSFLLVFNFISSQNQSSLKITESEEYKDEVTANNILAIHTTNNGLTGIVRDSKKDILFDIFDTDLKKVFSKTVESDKRESFVGEIFFENEIKFFTVYAPEKTERILYCHIFNLENKTVTKEKLFETTVEKNQDLFAGGNKRQTSFAISPNGNYFAVATDNIKKNVNSYTVRVFNASNLQLVYEKAYQEHEERFYQHNDLSIDDNANVYTLGKLYIKGRSEKKKGEANYQFVLNKLSKTEAKELTIDLAEEHILSLNISTTANELHLLGFYSEKNIFRIKGGCNFIIDTDALSVKSKNIYKLPIEVYEDLYGEDKADNKKDKELSNFYVDYVLKDTNGNTYILAEAFYITQTYVSTGTGGGYFITTPHYDDILILNFDANGTLNWGRSVFKKSGSPSYNAFLKGNELHVILNSGKNLTEKNDGRTKVSKGLFESSSLYDFVYSANGEVSYNKIQDNSGNTYYIPFYGTYQNDTFIMTSDGKKKKQFMILK
ncbi:hypothetical protein [Algibacter sp.]|uniref:hypothetical protein n=1 Tax=Algibacter sp. TaxID=1872428 RepID=UPI003C719990